ncbi:MAG: RNA polymerase factor sigma-54 [Lachnospiraceae bacterium]|nr:RNA polymerase factor sigma-54 [Lachnospiraceae bacterium]
MRLNSVQLQKQVQQQKASQRMLQSLEVLYMNQVELKDYLQEAYESNPLLELVEATPAYGLMTSADGAQKAGDEMFGQSEEAFRQTFAEYLYEQLMFLPNMDDEQRMLCKYLILCLDHKGYLEDSLDELAVRVGTTIETLEEALFQLQQLEPAGVGARSLEECLMIQAKRDPKATEVVYQVIAYGITDTSSKQLEKMAANLQCDRKQVEDAVQRILTYQPIPADGYSDGSAIAYTIPEAEVILENGRLTIRLNRSFLPRLSYNAKALELLEAQGKEAQAYLNRCKRAAESVLGAMQERDNTMRLLLEYVVGWQKDYFRIQGPLRPLTMHQVAEAIGVHPSTISRAVREKYILFQGRQLMLKQLFVSKVQDGTSSHAVKERMRSLIAREIPQNPYSDEAMVTLLAEEGITISRRTVAKYRKELQLPAAHQRKRSE